MRKFIGLLLSVALLVSGCAPQPSANVSAASLNAPVSEAAPPAPAALETARPAYSPGELVDYTVQTGDTVKQLAVRFNTTETEIHKANPIIPADATTLPPGMPMKVPIYYEPLWGSSNEIIPDSYFVNGPSQLAFNSVDFVDSQPGWFKNYSTWVNGQNMRGGELADYIALNYSISPQLLLALVEFHTGALTSPTPPEDEVKYPFGHSEPSYNGLYRQMVWAANWLNNRYYDYRASAFTKLNLNDGTIEELDPWINASTAALKAYFAMLLPAADYHRAVSKDGFAALFGGLFGDPWQNDQPHIPGSLRQPEFRLPFEAGKSWAYTGGPHTGWGEGGTFSALDFAPPAVVGGCRPTEEWATAVADGVIARKETAIAVLDLDGDGDERTGWVVFYLHLATDSIPAAGTRMKAGQPIGHPSCEGGRSTGTHVHIARKFNGEWILADGIVPFNLDGWTAVSNNIAYQGSLVKNGRFVVACTCSDHASQIQAEPRPQETLMP